MWDAQWEQLAAAFRVIRFDFPGAGRSPDPDGPFAPRDLVAGLMDALEVDRAALVGVSYGSGVAIDFAIERPERAWALMAVATNPSGSSSAGDIPPDPRRAEAWEALLAGDVDRAMGPFMDLVAPLHTSSEVDGSIRRMVEENLGRLTALNSPDLVRAPSWRAIDRLGEIRLPTLVIWGDHESQGIDYGCRRLARDIAGARHAVLPQTDHFVPMRSPAAFTQELLAFLSRHMPVRVPDG